MEFNAARGFISFALLSGEPEPVQNLCPEIM
jgi:hypothetical protein